MKIVFFYLETSKEEWLAGAIEVYEGKIKRFVSDFEVIKIKSPRSSRDNQDYKIKEESKLILSKLNPQDFLILCDEKGKELNSLQFSTELQRVVSRNPKRIVFLIGGAFGVSAEIQLRAQLKLSLSKLVFNHHIAIAVALEQIYRAFAIQKGLPYHNE